MARLAIPDKRDHDQWESEQDAEEDDLERAVGRTQYLYDDVVGRKNSKCEKRKQSAFQVLSHDDLPGGSANMTPRPTGHLLASAVALVAAKVADLCGCALHEQAQADVAQLGVRMGRVPIGSRVMQIERAKG